MGEEESLTERRKAEHLAKALLPEAQYDKTTLLEYVEFIHNALPEMDLEKVDTSTTFLGRNISAPMLVLGMTGGYKRAKDINIGIAKACEKFNIPMGVGSQRAMVEKPELKETYDVKKEADVFVIGNIGAAQIKEFSNETIESLVKDINADALAIHVNPLQEAIQPEGDINFEGVLNRIAEIKDFIDVPVIVKEVGAGISGDVVKRLKDIGIEWVDVSGSGGTSWSKMEYMRGGEPSGFENWGIPTAVTIVMGKQYANIIASGGIRSGIDGAKALALGAKMFGAATPVLKAYMNGSLDKLISEWINQLRIVMFLTGSKTIEELSNHIYIYGKLYEILNYLGLKP